MSHLIFKLLENGTLKRGDVPSHFPTSIQYLTITGSKAYGVSKDSSDLDIYGFCIPKKEDLFPHLRGEIPGFGIQKGNFEQWQMHHIKTEETEYDFSVYSIIKYFQLCMENNPNMVDTLFTPLDCVVHCTEIGRIVRDNRKLFLSKLSYHKFRGYAFSQLHKMSIKTDPKSESRKKDVEDFGIDLKFAYHLVRLVLESEQILKYGDLDLRKDSKLLSDIRGGLLSKSDITNIFESKQKELEILYKESNVIPHKPKEDQIKSLLLDCLEQYYGSISSLVKLGNIEEKLISNIENLIHSYRNQ